MEQFSKKYIKYVFPSLLGLFVFIIPYQIRVFFNDSNIAINSDFTVFSLYLSDIVGIILIISLLVYLFTNLERTKGLLKNLISINNLLLLLFIIIGFISLYYSGYFAQTLYGSFKLLEFALIAVLSSYIFSIRKYRKLAGIAFIASTTLQAIIGIFQYLFQKNLGLKLLFESQFDASTQNIAKLSFDNEEIIRAYGTMPHSNILGGLLAIGLLISLYFIFNQSRGNNKKSHLYTNLLLIAYFVQFTGLILSYSRSAWLAFAISILSIIILAIPLLLKKRDISLKTIFNRKLVVITFVLIIGSLAIITINSKNVKARLFDHTNIAQEENIDIRNSANNFALDDSSKNLFGRGIRTFVPEYTSSNQDLPEHYWQPAHNIFSLITYEMGAIGAELFAIMFIYALTRAIIISLRKGYLHVGIPIAITALTIGFFDHYLWTLQQGQLILWISLGLLFAASWGVSKITKIVPRGTISSDST